MKDAGAKLTLFLTFCAAALLLVATCYAQQGPPPKGGPPSAQQELARMTKALTLTEAQSRAILPILEDRHQAIGTLMQNAAGREANEAQSEAIRSQMRTLFDTTNKEIKVLLTEDQQRIFDQMRPPHPPSGGAAGPGSSGTNNVPPPPSNEATLAPPQPF